MKKIVHLTAAGTLIALGLVAQSKDANKTEAPEVIYKRQCTGCHGADMAGQTSMGKTFKIRDLRSAEVQKQTDAQLLDAIAKGKGKMPAYENKLGHDNIQALVKYIRAQAKK